ncbi:MAG: hypothetical protein J5818_04220 [Eggerthellaceae bacterium]|nr:hypothetical protein [Eggerthellaceae bacterium]
MTNQNMLFRKNALEQVSSPASLDSYIQAVRPSTWLVAVAAIIVIAALLIWGFTGKVATTVVDNGYVHEGTIICYLNAQDHAQVSVGDRVLVDNEEATIDSVSTTPVSSKEAGALVRDDYTRSMLALEDWNYPVHVTMDNMPAEGTLVQIVITTDEVAPIAFLLDSELGNGEK